MANLPESASFDAGVYQIETTDAVIGGVNGISNLQAKALANRTTWLKQQVDALNLLKGKGIAAFSAANSYAGGDQVIYQKNIWQANTEIVPGAWNAANWTQQLGTSAEGELSSTLPVIDGVAAIGTSTAVARADHKHPTDTTRAPLASPTFTGTPTAPTAANGTSTTQIASTAFVQAQLAATFPAASETVAGKVELATAVETTTGTDNTRAVHPAGLKVELDKKAPLASPALTGTPTAPTAAAGTSTTQVATTAYVIGQAATVVSPMDGTAAVGTSLRYARQDHVHASDTSRLPLTGGTLTGPIDLNRSGAIASGLSWYSPSYNTWQEYMGQAGFASQGVRGNVTPPVGSLVSSWGRRSYIENSEGFGWVFESAANGSTTPTIMMELSSVTGAAKFTGAITAPTFNGALAGNASSASSATTLSGDQSNWASIRSNAVANMLGWNNYGNGHVIFDASKSISPSGSAVNDTNSAIAWTAALPTLMGWNGSTTYGVRVDSARVADSLTASPALTGVPTAPTASAGTNTQQLASTAFVQAAVGVGNVSLFAMTTPPTGWLKANGAAVNRATYAALFTAIGTTFGAGNGSTTFNLPDLRGEFVRGWDDGRGLDTGRVFGSAQLDQFENHTHYSTNSGWVGNGGNASGGSGVAFGNAGAYSAASGKYGAETRPRNVALLYCIKY